MVKLDNDGEVAARVVQKSASSRGTLAAASGRQQSYDNLQDGLKLLAKVAADKKHQKIRSMAKIQEHAYQGPY